jgi:hypothetical protein
MPCALAILGIPQARAEPAPTSRPVDTLLRERLSIISQAVDDDLADGHREFLDLAASRWSATAQR